MKNLEKAKLIAKDLYWNICNHDNYVREKFANVDRANSIWDLACLFDNRLLNKFLFKLLMEEIISTETWIKFENVFYGDIKQW